MDHISRDLGSANGCEIIELTERCAAFTADDTLAQIDGYWNTLRHGRLVPNRSEVNPRDIESALGNAFIIERIAKGHARIRIAGTHLTDIMGMEVRGMPLSALFEPVARAKLSDAVQTLFDGPCIQHFYLDSDARIGRPALRAQMALYPLRNDAGEISRALGCFVTDGRLGRAPRRFNVIGSRRKSLSVPTHIPVPTPQLTYEQPKAPQTAAAAERAPEFQNTAVPWLRVVKGPEA